MSPVDLNSAEIKVLVTALDVSKEAAEAIVRWRNFIRFETADDLRYVFELSDEDRDRITELTHLEPTPEEAVADPIVSAIYEIRDVLARGDTKEKGPKDIPIPPGSPDEEEDGGEGQENGEGEEPGAGVKKAKPKKPVPPPPLPREDYVKDIDAGVFHVWGGAPGSHPQIHIGEGFAFSLVVEWGADGKIQNIQITNLETGKSEKIKPKLKKGESITYVAKKGHVILIVITRKDKEGKKRVVRTLTYDGKAHKLHPGPKK